MDRKRAMTSVDLAALVGELRDYTGAVVDKAYLYGDDFVRLKMRDYDRGRIELLIEVGDPKRAHVAVPEHVPDAPGRPPNFAMMLRNRIAGANFEGVEQYGFDRILTFRFEREDQTTLIVAELFGDGNIAVLNEDHEVIDCLDTVRLSARTVAPGAQYGYPDERFSPLDCSYAAFAAKMDESDSDLVRTLATQLNFGGLYAEELCRRAGVEKTTDIDEATDDDYEALFGALERLREPILEGRTDPRLYEDDGQVVDATPLPLEEHTAEGYDATAFEHFNGAIDAYFHRLQAEAETETDTGDDKPDFESEIAKFERIIEQQQGAIEEYEKQAEVEQQKAELLYGNYDLVDEICSTVQSAREEGVPWDEIETTFEEGAERGIDAAAAVVGVDAAEGTVTIDLDDKEIDLDPTMGVEKNADRLYQEAKRVRGKKEGAQAAIEDTREDLEDVKERRRQWEADDDEDDDADEESPDRDYLSMASVPVRYDEKWYEQFRWFRTSDDFLVIGGRDADQNEALVKKYMDPSDRFFHAQAHGGPVTILKATAPDEPAREVDIPDTSKREAAQFAVSYSSVWKDGKFEGDVYEVDPDQVSKTPESGEYIEKGGFVIRGDRNYYRDMQVGVAVGIKCEPDTRVIGGPPSAIEPVAETSVRLQPGQFAQNDIAKRLYRTFRERFNDTSFVRKIASADRIQEFCPPGGSERVE
ncbi:DUF814 domain protein [Natronomonas pharaonis DSM 2160]|uniref:Archaeal Rqc2 homolog aRqcH n=1 Tax=Natronomonas pharaonis (strain ATCC 35678 / DSM 2160 / CIP 103997 / JCM 8858 / NBRC 14720 / NCIMB 2260 / Gabara) TaxID=348780 RepID=A0A1U7EVP8_NATPD|nr:ribosome rescue protein RqcH [Natronomonas pharaonis]CAI49126.1 DUF814 domain protein [Natronomonas pharaonis DSM 2160]